MFTKINMKKLLTILITVFILFIFVGGCSKKDNQTETNETISESRKEFKSTEELGEYFTGKKVGILSGSVFDLIIQETIPGAEVVYFNSTTDEAFALDAGKIDAYVTDEPMARLLTKSYPNLYICGELKKSKYAYVISKDDVKSNEIRKELDEYILKIREDGTLKEIDSIWFGDDEEKKIVNINTADKEKGEFKLAACTAVGAPFIYVKDNKYVGYEVDIANRFCEAYGYKLVVTDYNFDGVLSSVTAGKENAGAGSICVTSERQKTMNFSEAIYDGSVVVVTNSKLKDGFFSSFSIDSLKDSFDKTFIKEDRWLLFLSGIGTTVLITMSAVIFGSLIGFGIFLIYRKDKKVINKILDLISGFLQLTPVVVILMIFYYIIFVSTDFEGVVVSTIAFILMFASSVLNLLKAAVTTIDKGQMEAVCALGYKDTRGFLRMIFPQAFINFIPGFKSEIVSLIKATSIVGYVAVQDLTKVTDVIRSRTYEAFFPLIATAIIYVLFALLLIKLVEYIEIKALKLRRSEKKILKGVKR